MCVYAPGMHISSRCDGGCQPHFCTDRLHIVLLLAVEAARMMLWRAIRFLPKAVPLVKNGCGTLATSQHRLPHAEVSHLSTSRPPGQLCNARAAAYDPTHEPALPRDRRSRQARGVRSRLIISPNLLTANLH